MDHVKQLKEKNNQLYESILKMGNKKQKKSLEYYVHLKKDLLAEQSKLNQQLSELEENKVQEKKGLSFKMYNLKKRLNETLSENKTLKSLTFEKSSLIKGNFEIYFSFSKNIYKC